MIEHRKWLIVDTGAAPRRRLALRHRESNVARR
jgi:hypothetical protein